MSNPRRTVVLGGALSALLLLAAAPAPAVAVRALREPASAGDVAAPLVALLSLLAWALAVWLLLTVAVTAAAHLPGLTGHAARSAARRLAPATVRRAVEVALGLSVVVGVGAAGPAAASPGPPTAPAAAAPSLDWAAPSPEGLAPEPIAPSLDWAARPAGAPRVAAEQVVVARGDSLWSLAERDLAARTGAAPCDGDIAQAWPAWWAANRDVVGDDPDVIQPGTRLSPPADGRTSS